MNTIKVDFELYAEAIRKGEVKAKPKIIENFIFDDFVLWINNSPHDTNGKLRFEVYHANSNERNYIYEEYPHVKGHHGFITKGTGYNYEIGYYRLSRPDVVSSAFRMLCFYMSYIMENIEKRKRKAMGAPRKHTREYRKSCVSDRVYLMDDLYIYAKDKDNQEREHHEMLCPCWEVRGHYRHYKSGKVVFIKAFKKGKEKDKVSPKNREYYL